MSKPGFCISEQFKSVLLYEVLSHPLYSSLAAALTHFFAYKEYPGILMVVDNIGIDREFYNDGTNSMDGNFSGRETKCSLV